jgi:hypothetical protein
VGCGAHPFGIEAAALKLNRDGIATVLVVVDAAHTIVFGFVALAGFRQDVAIIMAQPPAKFLLFILINFVLHLQPPYGSDRSPQVILCFDYGQRLTAMGPYGKV